MAVQPHTYKSGQPVYVDGIYHDAGKPFTTSAKAGEGWKKVTPIEKAAADAADKTLDVQPSLDELDLSALKALAATKMVETTVDGKPLSKKDLITAIKAVNEPTL